MGRKPRRQSLMVFGCGVEAVDLACFRLGVTRPSGRPHAMAGADPAGVSRPRSCLDVLCASRSGWGIASITRLIALVRFQYLQAVVDRPLGLLLASNDSCWPLEAPFLQQRAPPRETKSLAGHRATIIEMTIGACWNAALVPHWFNAGAAEGIGTGVGSIPGKVCRDS